MTFSGNIVFGHRGRANECMLCHVPHGREAARGGYLLMAMRSDLRVSRCVI